MAGARVLPVRQLGEVVVPEEDLPDAPPAVVSSDHQLDMVHGQPVGRVEPTDQRRDPAAHLVRERGHEASHQLVREAGRATRRVVVEIVGRPPWFGQRPLLLDRDPEHDGAVELARLRVEQLSKILSGDRVLQEVDDVKVGVDHHPENRDLSDRRGSSAPPACVRSTNPGPTHGPSSTPRPGVAARDRRLSRDDRGEHRLKFAARG